MAPFPARRADDPDPPSGDTAFANGIHAEIEELASRLAEHGIQSTDLVLDLVLHDLTEEARQAVNGTGAAIALERDGELVCRAAAGATAPDLGIRINRESGLSALCLQQRAAQLCGDAESDDRVDADASRKLGVRSIAVLPLFSENEVIGILEVFSDRLDAFSAADVNRLESLAEAAAQRVKAAREKSSPLPAAREITADESSSTDSRTLSVAEIMQSVTPVDPAVKVLRWLVIGLAIPLVVLIGFDWGWHRARVPVSPNSAASRVQGETESQAESSPPVTLPDSAPAGLQKKTASHPNPATDLARRGGLVIYQNGKVIYSEGPAPANKTSLSQKPTRSDNAGSASEKTSGDPPPNGAAGTAEPASSPLPAGISGGQLLHSVRPDYPADAIAQKLEGSVLLHGVVGQDGIVHDLKLIRGNPVLADAAISAVRQWRYQPYQRNGSTIAMPMDITIDFNLPK